MGIKQGKRGTGDQPGSRKLIIKRSSELQYRCFWLSQIHWRQP